MIAHVWRSGVKTGELLHSPVLVSHNISSDVLEEAFRTKCMSTGQVRINMLIFDSECQQAHHTQRTLAI